MAALRDLRIDALEFAIRGYFDRRGGRVAGAPNRGFEEIHYETRIQSPEPPDRIRELAAGAGFSLALAARCRTPANC